MSKTYENSEIYKEQEALKMYIIKKHLICDLQTQPIAQKMLPAKYKLIPHTEQHFLLGWCFLKLLQNHAMCNDEYFMIVEANRVWHVIYLHSLFQ